MISITTILDKNLEPDIPVFTDWFFGCRFLVFQSSTVGEYVVTDEFLKVSAALFVRLSPGPLGIIERKIDTFQNTIDTVNLINLPEEYDNNLLPFRLLLKPFKQFHARILTVSC